MPLIGGTVLVQPIGIVASMASPRATDSVKDSTRHSWFQPVAAQAQKMAAAAMPVRLCRLQRGAHQRIE